MLQRQNRTSRRAETTRAQPAAPGRGAAARRLALGLLALGVLASGLGGCAEEASVGGGGGGPGGGGGGPGGGGGGGGGSADATPPDFGPPWDATPGDPRGPLFPRVENQTCRLPDPPQIGNFDVVDAWPNLAFNRAVWFGHAPGQPGLRFVVEQAGRIRVFDAANPGASEVFLDIRVSREGNEEGLLGLAFHPQYATNGKFYLYYSATDPRRSIISELQVDPQNPKRGLRDTERVLLEVPQPFSNHNGGDLHFGPDGHLYIALGDGGSGGDPHNHGQRPETVLGAILRIDVNRTRDAVCNTAYGIPEDNPFAAGRCAAGAPAGQPEVYAYGLRNPWRMRFDATTGELWVADVGQDRVEEINVVRKGGNYGWKPMEGNECYVPGCDPSLYEAPVWTYDHTEGKSITGGLVYRGARHPELWGAYLFADYDSGRIWALRRTPGAAPQVTLLADTDHRITSFGADPDGEVFITAFTGTSGILTLQTANNRPPPAEPVPALLSRTGCFTDLANDVLAPGVVPYAPRAPFWSDHAEKGRYVALPAGTRATWRAEGGLDFPVGTVTIKNFDMPQPDGSEKRFETRLFHKSNLGWIGYSYRWNEAGTEANLLDGAESHPIQGPATVQMWDYPSRAQCNSCHTPEANYALGLTGAQLNFDWAYPDGTVFNQLAAWAAAGYLDLPDAPANLPKLVDPFDESEPLEARARAWLDSNCASCHLPGGGANANLDLRARAPLAVTGLCNAEPTQGDFGIAGARLLVPGDPQRSLVLQRTARRGEGQMPPLGSNVFDLRGVELLDAWIRSNPPCP